MRKKHKKEHPAVTQQHTQECPITLDMPLFFIDPGYADIYTTFRKYIESSIKTFTLSSEINFQLKHFTNEEIAEYFKSIYYVQTTSFKVSLSVSSILMNKETRELAFYTASRNNQLIFDDPRLIKTETDFKRMYNDIISVDLQDRITYPNTKFVYVKTTNVVFFITKLIDVPIGSGVSLPNYLLHNKGLISLVKSSKTGKEYLDNLCFFRCLALFRGFDSKSLERETKRLCKQYCEIISINYSEFKGICISELQHFQIGVNIYIQRENRNTELVFRSLKQDPILYLNLFGTHFSMITDFAKYSSRYRCVKCDAIFKHNGNFRRHLRTCNGITRKVYCNGIFRLNETIFEKLERNGMEIPFEDRIFPYRIVFDCEVYLSSEDTPTNTSKVEYSYKHHLASISVCSNVPGFQNPKCYISTGSPRDLVENAIQYMLKISAVSASLLKDHYKDYIEMINDDDLYEQFEQYMKQIPVLGFNN